MAHIIDGWGIADLHAHTRWSDGDDTPSDVLDWAARIGLDVIAITDHDAIEGAEEAADLAEARGDGPDVVVGAEISSRDGHVLALFISELIRKGMSAAATVEAIHEQGGIAIAAHPFWRHAPDRGYSYGVGPQIHTVAFDAVEVLNGGFTPSMITANQRAAAAAGGLTRVGGSDAHVRRALGWAHTRFPGRSAADLRSAIAAGQTRAGRSRIDPVGVSRYAGWSLGRLRAGRATTARERSAIGVA